MGYTKITDTIKWWDPHTKKLKYFLSAEFDEHNNKFGKGWSPGSELMTGTNISSLKKLKLISHITPLSNMVYLKSLLIYHQQLLLLVSLKNTVKITTCYIYPSQQKNRSWNRGFTAQNRTNVWVLIICIKEPETAQQVLEAISSQQSTGKFNRVNVITSCRHKNTTRTNLQ